MPCRQRHPSLIERYRDRLPVGPDTPLIKLRNLPDALGKDIDLYVKFEGLNPTCSFKDRGMTLAVTKAVEAGAQAIICASTGNTSASAAAYAARAGITAFVIIPNGKIAAGKMAQAMMHGAVTLQIAGNFDVGMQLVKHIADQAPVSIVNSINPFRLQGQKTIAFEIIEQLGRAPDYHCLPVGNAGNITAHWIGYSEYASVDGRQVTAACNHCNGHCPYAHDAVTDSRPVMVGYQAAGAAPFIHNRMIDNPETVATAIRIGHPQSWDYARHASNESGGWFDACADADILAAQKLLAEREGIFCEPASAVALAGAMRDIQRGNIPAGSSVVCTLTGNGLKDPDTAVKQATAPIITVDATPDAVKRAIFDHLP